jgi:putative membrane protein
MKSKITFISRVAVFAIGTSLALSSVHAQDVSGHETVDNPHLRKTTTPAPSAGAAAQSKLSQKDSKFISQAAASGAIEVQDGKVAEQQGGASVKNVASRIVADRSANNQELMALAKKKGLALSTDKIKARNMGKSNFDAQYIHTVSRDYQEDISLFSKAAQSADDKDVKAYASKSLPMLKQHLSMLNSAKGKGASKEAPPKE